MPRLPHLRLQRGMQGLSGEFFQPFILIPVRRTVKVIFGAFPIFSPTTKLKMRAHLGRRTVGRFSTVTRLTRGTIGTSFARLSASCATSTGTWLAVGLGGISALAVATAVALAEDDRRLFSKVAPTLQKALDRINKHVGCETLP